MKSWWFDDFFSYLVNWPCLVQQPINPCANIYTILYTNTQTYTHMYRQTHPQQCSIWWSFTDVLVGESEILCPVQNDGWTDANRNKHFFFSQSLISCIIFFLLFLPTSISCLFPPSFLHCIFSSFISSHVSLRSSFLIPSYWSFVLPIFHHSWAAALGGGLSPVEYRVNQCILTSLRTSKGPQSLLLAPFLCFARSVKNFWKRLLCTVGTSLYC